MNYYLDTEFLEGPQKKRLPLFDIVYGKTANTIDLISIGIVSEDDREYYAISKDFNLKEAWNRYDLKVSGSFDGPQIKERVYWIRENVLKPIYIDMLMMDGFLKDEAERAVFSFRMMKFYLNKYGKTNAEIAKEVLYFCSNGYFDKTGFDLNKAKEYELYDDFKPEFYAYYADYDWVVFCWLFGKMMDLPKGFPMYCRDLKQMMDEAILLFEIDGVEFGLDRGNTFNESLKKMKSHHDYPKQENEHNALDDARWNKKLHEFLKELK